MAVIFSKAVGQVASFPDPTLPANISLRVENWGGFFNFKSIITRITVSAKGNYQFLHTLGGQVFVYVFGDRIGDLVLQGFAFDSVCGNPVGLLGIESVLNYYSANRIAARRTPLRITIGASTTLRAYLLDVTGDVQDTKSRMWRFSLHLALIPRDVDTSSEVVGDDSSGSSSSGGGSGSGSGGTTSTINTVQVSPTQGGSEIVLPPEQFAAFGGDTFVIEDNGRVTDPAARASGNYTNYSAAGSGANTGLVRALP